MVDLCPTIPEIDNSDSVHWTEIYKKILDRNQSRCEGTARVNLQLQEKSENLDLPSRIQVLKTFCEEEFGEKKDSEIV